MEKDIVKAVMAHVQNIKSCHANNSKEYLSKVWNHCEAIEILYSKGSGCEYDKYCTNNHINNYCNPKK